MVNGFCTTANGGWFLHHRKWWMVSVPPQMVDGFCTTANRGWFLHHRKWWMVSAPPQLVNVFCTTVSPDRCEKKSPKEYFCCRYPLAKSTITPITALSAAAAVP